MDRLGTARTLSASRRAGLLVPLAAILVGGCSAAATASPSQATNPTGSELGVPAIGALAAGAGGPAVAPVPNGLDAGVGSTGSSPGGSAAAAIAYPYPGFGGSVGLAPDHELVVSGTGWANVKVDMSDRASAQRTALSAALADAKSQAQAAASDAGLTLGGVVSLSVSVGGNYALPMGIVEPSIPAPSTGGAPAVPPASSGSAQSGPTSEQLEVTVTVGYSIS